MQTRGSCLHLGADEICQTSDAVKGTERSVVVAERHSKRFFDAKGELEYVERVEAKTAAVERRVIGNFIRLKKVHPEQVSDELLESREQRTSCMAAIVHVLKLTPNTETRHGVCT